MGSGLMFSPDGGHFWDGQKWQSAISPDGHWRWDGRQWTPVDGASLPVPVPVPGSPAPSPAAANPWSVVTPRARSLATPVQVASAPRAGALPGLDGPKRKSNRVIGYRKEPTIWTNRLVLFATLYFIGGGIYGFVVSPALAPEYHDRWFSALRATSQLSTRQADDLATFATSVFVGVLVFFSAIAVLLGLLSFRRITLVFYLQVIGGFFSVLDFMIALSLPADQRALIAPNIFWSSVLMNLIGGALFFWMIFARRAYGPWGLRRVPVYAEPLD